MSESEFDADVAVVGSGFGGAVAALRFAEAGERVLVLERGPWISREDTEVDLDWFWEPRRHRFGMNDLRKRGKNIVPWLGAGVGGGSHAYAGTLKRLEHWDGFPSAIADDDMAPFFERAEVMMGATPYPDHPPYGDLRAAQLLFQAEERVAQQAPELVEDWGPVPLGISFAPEGVEPGTAFINPHGAEQRYWDPSEQALLGGDIGAKNSLDYNYLFVAQERGAEIRAMSEVDKVEPIAGGGYRLHYTEYVPETSGWRRFLRKWLPSLIESRDRTGSVTARRVVLAAGAVGSTELLLRNRDVHGTLPGIGRALGHKYTTNGDFMSLVLPFRGLIVAWAGFFAALWGLIFGPLWLALAGIGAYAVQLLLSRSPFDPDIGTTNSDFIRFRGVDGETQGAYIEGGRYPTPVRLIMAVMLSVLGVWRPSRYRWIIRVTKFLRAVVPPFALLARTWPIPLLEMGRDRAFGTFRLEGGRAVIDYDVDANRRFYRYLNRLGRMVARAAKAWWLPNLLFYVTGKLEVPHNQGGVPMADGPEDGVVDHAGRVFGYRNLMVLDGAIIPVSLGPNPALTILALAERGVERAIAQIEAGGDIEAEPPPERESAASAGA